MLFVSYSKFNHKNIVRCLGITSDAKGELLLVLELMEGGDLKKYLRSHIQREVRNKPSIHTLQTI
jgi:serine/threonine protein kinase